MNPLKRPDGFIVTQAKLDTLNTLIDGSNCRQAVEHPIPRMANPNGNHHNANAVQQSTYRSSYCRGVASTSRSSRTYDNAKLQEECPWCYR